MSKQDLQSERKTTERGEGISYAALLGIGAAMRFPERFRWENAPHGYASNTGDHFGCFQIPGRQANGRGLNVIAVGGEGTGWEHVSVSLADHKSRCPSWDEMCIVKKLFWEESACVVQYHPPEADYVDNAQVLHLWRCVDQKFPMPPKVFV